MPTLNDKLDEIKRQKDLYILPQNLKKDVTVFGVTGTLEAGSGEDLEAEISAQEEYIAQLEAIIDEKAQGESTPNIFLQTTEPAKKQGIWLQVADKEYEKIVAEDSVVTEPTWLLDGTFGNVPYSFTKGSTVIVGDYIYLLGGENSKVYNYKYDTLTDTYTQLTDIPYEFYNGSAITIGTDIYLFGSTNSSYSKYNYKYNTLTDTYTRLADIPYDFFGGSATRIGTDIYLLGSSNANKKCNYKYNTLTDTYVQLSDIPYSFMYGSITSIGTNIYLFGSTYANYQTKKYNYKYDTLTDTYTKMTNIPYNFNHGYVVSSGTNIYLFGGQESSTNNYKYDTLTDTYTQLTDIPYAFSDGNAILVKSCAYLFGGSEYPTKVQVLAFPSSDFDDKSLVLLNGTTYKTQLLSNDLFDSSVKNSFADVWLYEEDNGLLADIPTYYGNGTQWINIKNPPVEEVEE